MSLATQPSQTISQASGVENPFSTREDTGLLRQRAGPSANIGAELKPRNLVLVCKYLRICKGRRELTKTPRIVDGTSNTFGSDVRLSSSARRREG